MAPTEPSTGSSKGPSARRGPSVEVDVAGVRVRISSPDRPYWSDGQRTITKFDVCEYYASVARALLDAVRARPTTLQRFPRGVLVDGVPQEAFYNKHLPKGAPDFVGRVTVTFPSGRTGVQVCPGNEATLVWAANLGCVTFHPWPARVPDVDHPDELRLDLDPHVSLPFSACVEVAEAVRSILVESGLRAFVKTSGGRGLHVFAPIVPEWDFIAARHAAIAVAREAERRLPDLVTTSWWKEDRGRRVFIDFNQMCRDRTMASAWSLRPRPGAPVSTPVPWAELSRVDPGDFTIDNVPALLGERGDPWAGMAEEPGNLSPLLALWDADVDRGLGEMPYPPDHPKMPGEPPRVQPSRRASAERSD